jgi:hypothetical protein
MGPYQPESEVGRIAGEGVVATDAEIDPRAAGEQFERARAVARQGGPWRFDEPWAS